MRIARPRTALLITSAATDVQRSGVAINITGLDPISERNLIKIMQIKYRAEVSKVETIGATYTPVAATGYIVEIADPTSSRESHSNSVVPTQYTYNTPADITTLGATAALQREAINAALVVKINADSAKNITAVSLGTGTGFTLTDNAGYYPAKTAGGINPRAGKSTILVVADRNGRGFVDATDRVLTTDAVYQFGEGTRLLKDAPVVYALGGGNIIAGELDCPLTTAGLAPVGGQQYDAFSIDHLVRSEIPTIGEVVGYRVASSVIFADNGLGNSTTNRTGFLAFERQMHKLLFSQYNRDPKSTIEFFDTVMIFNGPLGAVPDGTVGTTKINAVLDNYTTLQHCCVGTATIVVPKLGANGILLDQDLTDTEGSEITAPVNTVCDQQFVVGTDEISLICKFSYTDITAGGIYVGFRKKAAHAAAFSSYTDIALIGMAGGVTTGVITSGTKISTYAILGSAAAVYTDSTKIAVNAISQEVRMKVAIDGTVTCYHNNVAIPIYSAGTTVMKFAAGTVLIPTMRATNVGGGTPVSLVTELVAIADASWKVDA